MIKFIAGHMHMTKRWFLKLWITSFLTQILHLNFTENIEKMMYINTYIHIYINKWLILVKQVNSGKL